MPSRKDPGQKRRAYETPYGVTGQRQVPTNKTRRGTHKQYKQSTKRGAEGFGHWSGSRSTKSRYGLKGWQSGRTVGVGRGLSSSKGAGSRYKQKPQKHYGMGGHGTNYQLGISSRSRTGSQTKAWNIKK